MECNPVAPASLHVRIETIVGNIRLATEEPLRNWLLPIERLCKGLEPVQVLSGLGFPKLFGIANRGLVKSLISIHRPDFGSLRKFATRRKDPRFVHHIGDLLGGFGFRTVLSGHRFSRFDAKTNGKG